MPTHAIGIDLGTSYFRVGVVHQGKIKIITDDHDQSRIRNIVTFTYSGSLIGESARDQATTCLKNTVFNVKRLIGRDFYDPKVQSDLRLLPFDITNLEENPSILVKP